MKVKSKSELSVKQDTGVMRLFISKVVEFSKANKSIEDFAADVLSSFTLSLNEENNSPRYSKIKPNPEEVQQKILSLVNKKPKPSGYNASDEEMQQMLDVAASEDILDTPVVVNSFTPTKDEMSLASDIKTLTKPQQRSRKAAKKSAFKSAGVK